MSSFGEDLIQAMGEVVRRGRVDGPLRVIICGGASGAGSSVERYRELETRYQSRSASS